MIHQHRVDVRNVDAVLDDRAGEHEIVVSRLERVHTLGQLVLRQLAVSDDDSSSRTDLAQLLRHLLDALDANPDPVTEARARQAIQQIEG